MLFQKSAPHVGRSAFAAKAKSKKLWPSSSANANQSHPSFFVSTPQFNRHQQNQVAPLLEDARGAGNSDSYSIENPYLPLTAGATGSTGVTHSLGYDDEAKEEQLSRSRSSVQMPNIVKSPSRTSLAPPLAHRVVKSSSTSNDESAKVVYQVVDTIDHNGSASIIDGILMKMHRLHAAGSYRAVLDTFESMDATEQDIPIDAYNLVLQSLVKTCDVSTQLQAYERMLARGVVPDNTTYSILLSSLVDEAGSLMAKRNELLPILGSNPDNKLESVEEIYEGLAAEEYLVLAQQILLAIIASRSSSSNSMNVIDPELQVCINQVVDACCDYNIEIPEALTSVAASQPEILIRAQPSIHLAADQFSSLAPEDQQSEGTQIAMLASYFRFKEPQGAIAFYSGCGAPSYLLKQLIIGFAANGYVATARRWSEQNEVDNDTISATLNSIPTEHAEQSLPSATRLFYRLVGGGGSGSNGNEGGDATSSDGGDFSPGRCSFLRLCVAAKHNPALIMAIRESKLSNCVWDATTISEVTAFLSESEPLLAADVCTWQVQKMQEVHEKKSLKSFVSEEIVADTVSALKKNNNLSLDAALRVLPVVGSCIHSRAEVLEILAKARLDSPEEVSRLMDSQKAISTAATLATLIMSRTSRLTEEEFFMAQKVFPLFVRDCISHKAHMNGEDVLISEALLVYYPESDVKRDFDDYSNVDRLSAARASPQTDAEINVTTSAIIQRYAKAPNGLDHAIRMLESEIRLRRNVTPAAVSAILQACVECNARDIIGDLCAILPKTQANLNLLAVYTAQLHEFELTDKCYNALFEVCGVAPTSNTYVELLKAYQSKPKMVIKLYQDALAAENVELDAEAYNCVLQSQAQALQKKNLTEILEIMHHKQFSITPQTYGCLLSMYVRMNEGRTALKMLKNMSLVTKSLLEVKIFNHIMHYFVHRVPDKNSALEAFVELRNTGTLATPYTYRLLMEAYLLRNDGESPSVDNADKVLALMKHDGAPITNQCFATLLRARGVLCKDFYGARDFYRGLVKSSRVLPDKGIFKALLESYIINGHQEESKLVFDEMSRYHVPVDEEMRGMVPITN